MVGSKHFNNYEFTTDALFRCVFALPQSVLNHWKTVLVRFVVKTLPFTVHYCWNRNIKNCLAQHWGRWKECKHTGIFSSKAKCHPFKCYRYLWRGGGSSCQTFLIFSHHKGIFPWMESGSHFLEVDIYHLHRNPSTNDSCPTNLATV